VLEHRGAPLRAMSYSVMPYAVLGGVGVLQPLQDLVHLRRGIQVKPVRPFPPTTTIIQVETVITAAMLIGMQQLVSTRSKVCLEPVHTNTINHEELQFRLMQTACRRAIFQRQLHFAIAHLSILVIPQHGPNFVSKSNCSRMCSSTGVTT